MNPARRLTPAQENSLAIAAAVVTANAYYIHPIIALVADHFGVSHARIGLVPALNQLALAVGIFLLLPLGDRYSNRRLTILFASGQTVSLALMTLASGFGAFVFAVFFFFFAIRNELLGARGGSAHTRAILKGTGRGWHRNKLGSTEETSEG